MKQPEVFKQWREKQERPILSILYEYEKEQLNNLREKAIHAIKVYKRVKQRLEQRDKDKKEVI